jgi:hypothetical protein
MLDGTEQSMIAILEREKQNILKNKYHKKYLTKGEFGPNLGIADLVFCRLNDKVVKDRSQNGHSALVEYELLETYLFICENFKQKRSTSVTCLSESLPYSKRKLREKIITKLQELDAVEEIGEEEFIPRWKYKEGITDCLSIEAKISNWQRGLYQAYRYKWFSDTSYLALYDSRISPALKNIDLFKKLNVGLLGVKDDGIEIYYQPLVENDFNTTYRALTFERFLSFVDDRQDAFVLPKPFARSGGS